MLSLIGSNPVDALETTSSQPRGGRPMSDVRGRVPRGQLVVTGSPKNKYASANSSGANQVGLNQVSSGSMTPDHDFGTQAYTNGRPLPTTDNHVTTVYEKP